jgi:hypothetical protein
MLLLLLKVFVRFAFFAGSPVFRVWHESSHKKRGKIFARSVALESQYLNPNDGLCLIDLNMHCCKCFWKIKPFDIYLTLSSANHKQEGPVSLPGARSDEKVSH